MIALYRLKIDDTPGRLVTARNTIEAWLTNNGYTFQADTAIIQTTLTVYGVMPDGTRWQETETVESGEGAVAAAEAAALAKHPGGLVAVTRQR